MKHKILKSSVAIVSALAFTTSVYAIDVGVNVSADAIKTNIQVNADAKLTLRIDKAKEKANQEIDRRIEALNKLNENVNKMVRVSADVKTKIATSITEQINFLTTLKAKISADTDIEVLKTDIKSITQSYRIFMLVIPQGRITATVDAINTAISMMEAYSVKLQSKITLAQNAGKDITALNTLLIEINSKLADAKVQTTAAIGYTSNLKPDNGDKTLMKSNNGAFARARADIRVARQDLETARQNARKILNGLREMKIDLTASTTTP